MANKSGIRGVFEKDGSWYRVFRGKWIKLCRVSEGRTALLIALGDFARTHSGTVQRASAQTVLELVDEYLQLGTAKLAAATVRSYMSAASTAVFRAEWAQYKLTKVKQNDIANYLFRRSEGTPECAAAPTAANRELALLSSAFQYGLQRKLVDSNICRGVRRNRESPSNLFVTDTELHHFLSAARQKPALSVLCRMAWITGARAGALVKMQTDNVEYGREKGTPVAKALVWREPKTGKVFRMPANDELRGLIEEANKLPRRQGVTALLVSGGGRAWTSNSITMAIARTLRLTRSRSFVGPEIKQFSFRSIRKGAAINAAKHGVNLLGHKQKMLEIYLQEETVSPNPLKE